MKSLTYNLPESKLCETATEKFNNYFYYCRLSRRVRVKYNRRVKVFRCGRRTHTGDNLTIFEIIDTFTFYGMDVILLAALTAFTVQVFKWTFLKRIKRKLLTFLPFFMGTFYYATYSAITHMDFFYIIKEYTEVLEHGVSIGAAATLLYVMYEQFVRDKDTVSPATGVIATLIDGYVPTENVERAAGLITEAIYRDVTGDGAAKAAEILADFCGEDVSERDVKLLSKLIIETLAHLNTQ